MLGSRTNLAEALQTPPEIKQNIAMLYIMGGADCSAGVRVCANPFNLCPEFVVSPSPIPHYLFERTKVGSLALCARVKLTV